MKQLEIVLVECKMLVPLVGTRDRIKANHLALEEHPNSTTRVQPRATTAGTPGSHIKVQAQGWATKMMAETEGILVDKTTVIEALKGTLTKTMARNSSMMNIWGNKGSKVTRITREMRANTISRSEVTETTDTLNPKSNRGPM